MKHLLLLIPFLMFNHSNMEEKRLVEVGVIGVDSTSIEEIEEIKRIAEFFSKRLELNNHKITIYANNSLPDKYQGYIFSSSVVDGVRISHININTRISDFSLYGTIGHELHHLKQMQDGRLVNVSKRIVIWEGEKYRNWTRIKYEDRPWEKECNDDEFRNALAYKKFKRKNR